MSTHTIHQSLNNSRKKLGMLVHTCNSSWGSRDGSSRPAWTTQWNPILLGLAFSARPLGSITSTAKTQTNTSRMGPALRMFLQFLKSDSRIVIPLTTPSGSSGSVTVFQKSRFHCQLTKIIQQNQLFEEKVQDVFSLVQARHWATLWTSVNTHPWLQTLQC